MNVISVVGCALLSLVISACGDGSGGQSVGDLPVELPPLLSPNQPPQISGSPGPAQEGSAFAFTPEVHDPDGDEVSVSVDVLPAWLSYDSASYTLSGTPGATDLGRSETITFTASDGEDSSELEIAIQVDYEPLQQALRSGDARYVSDAKHFLDSALNAADAATADGQRLRRRLFNLDASGQARADGSSLTDIHWDPTHDAGLLAARFGVNSELLLSNSVTKAGYTVLELPLAVAGEQAGSQRQARFLALGSNPMRNGYRDAAALNGDMQQLLRNSIAWLAGRENFAQQPLRVVIAQMGQSYYFPDRVATRQWLDEHYPGQVSYNDAQGCDGAALSACLDNDAELLIVSQLAADALSLSAATQAVAAWLDAGKPVLYLHHDGNLSDLGAQLLALLEVDYVADNYWRKLQLERFDVRQRYAQLPEDVRLINALLGRFQSDNFNVDLSLCDDKSCPPESRFAEEFGDAASAAKALFERLEDSAEPLFNSAGQIYQKSLLLLADSYRQQARFPMDKNATPRLAFLKSYFADHLNYQRRPINPAQADMGNFSRSDFSHISPVSKRVTLTSRQYFRAAGVYALPGQTVTVRRLDDSSVATTVFVNTLRSGATHQFSDNGYKRPKYLKGRALRIAPGETLSFTSAYGGPLQIGFDANDQQVVLQFDNVGEQPFWASAADNERFEAALAAADYDWAELSTPGFEVHSTLEKMRSSMGEWSDAGSLAAATERYMHNFAHVLAGFQGEGIDVVDEIHDFAAGRGWQIDTIDIVKHMNADQANCGYGCSGNPYDAYWAFNPVGHGDLHELGHGLERGRFRFAGWAGHASTNPYSYYAKSQYFRDTGNDPNCQSLPFAELKQVLLDSRNSADPFAYMQSQSLNSWSQAAAITLQMMMAAEAEGVLQDGWHLLARLHLLDREFNRADNSDAAWLAARDGLGFAQFSRAQARALANNDWMLIALSQSLGRDMRSYLDMWGLATTAAARAQVASANFPAMPLRFYDTGASSYCQTMRPAAIDIP